MKTIQIVLSNYNRRADNTVSLKVDSLVEVTSEDIMEIDSRRGNIGVLCITDTPTGQELEINTDEILRDMNIEVDMPQGKSPSQRVRAILWRLLEQQKGRKPTDEEFADYYKRTYDRIITMLLDKFEK